MRLFGTVLALNLTLFLGLPSMQGNTPDITGQTGQSEFSFSGLSSGSTGFAKKRSLRRAAPKLTYIRNVRMVVPKCGAFGAIPGVRDVLGCEEIERRAASGCPRGYVLRVDTRRPGEIQGWADMPADCIPAAAAAAGPMVTPGVVAQEFRVLPLNGSGLSYRPIEVNPVVNLPFIVMTDPAAQILETVILGIPIAIEASPISFKWDYGDGTEPFSTADPNKLYPNHSYEHTYKHTGKVQVTLVTTWQGRYRLPGGSWQPIPGTTTTTETSPVITVTELLPVNTNG